MTTPDFDHIFGGARVMAILRGLPVAETVRLAERAWDLGIDVVEVPVATADAVPALRAAVEAGAARDRIVGAGTVLDVEQVAAAADAGARVHRRARPGPRGRRRRRRARPAAPARRGHPHRGPAGTAARPHLAQGVPRDHPSGRPGSRRWPVRCRSCASSPPAASTPATRARSCKRAYARWPVGSALSDATQLDALAKLTRSTP